MNRFRVSCTRDNLKKIRAFTEQALSESGVKQKDTDLIVLAVDEICSNLIIHSNECDANRTLTIDIRIENNKGVFFEIMDNGKSFNYNDYEEPDVQALIRDKKRGSLGLMLVRRIMDTIEFQAEANQNVCKLFKRLNYSAVS